MNGFFTRLYNGSPFEMGGGSHIAALVFLIAVNFLLWALRSHFSLRMRSIIRWGLAGLLLLNMILYQAWTWQHGLWTIESALPLHLCSLMGVLSITLLICKKQWLYQLVYLVGTGAALMPLVTPDIGLYDFPHFRYFESFIAHGGIITSALFMTFVEGYRPIRKWVGRTWVIGNLYVGALFVINLALGSNYMFLIRKPETPSILDYMGPWPVYIAMVDMVSFLVVLFLYLPFHKNRS